MPWLEIATVFGFVAGFYFVVDHYDREVRRELERQFPSRARAWEDSGKGRP